jgi:hypothetical protein
MPYAEQNRAATIAKKKSKKEDAVFSEVEILEAKLLKDFIKPENFSHLEIKSAGNPGFFRVNVVTKTYKEGMFLPIVSRPTSWYVKPEEN